MNLLLQGERAIPATVLLLLPHFLVISVMRLASQTTVSNRREADACKDAPLTPPGILSVTDLRIV